LAQVKGTKAPVICLHGFPGLASDFHRLAAEFTDQRDLYAFPMPWVKGIGFGVDGFSAVVEYIASVFKATCSQPAHFVGYDIGGVALYWAARTRFGAEMKSMTLIAAPHPMSYAHLKTTVEARGKLQYIDRILESRDDAALIGDLLATVSGRDATVIDDIKVALNGTDFSAIRRLYSQIQATNPQTFVQETHQIDCPVAVIHAREDRYIPAGVMEDSVMRFGCRETTLTLPSDSHYPHLTDPAEVANFVERFWNALDE